MQNGAAVEADIVEPGAGLDEDLHRLPLSSCSRPVERSETETVGGFETVRKFLQVISMQIKHINGLLITQIRVTHKCVRGGTTMERQNVTLSLPKRLLKKAKVTAAQQDKSLSELMREALEYRISQCGEYERAKKRHLKLLERGFDLGTRGKLTVSREELHDRR